MPAQPTDAHQAALDLSWQQEQLDAAQGLVDKLGQQNDFLRNELLKRGVVVEGDEDRSFVLGGVPDGPMNSASFTDSAGDTGAHGKPEGSDSGNSIAPGLRYSLLQQVKESDIACGELEVLLDRLQSQLSSDDLKSVTPSPRASPFAAVAAGSRDDQLRDAKLLCGEVNRNVAKLRIGFSTVTNTLQQTLQQDGDGDSDRHVEEEPREEPRRAPERPPAWRDSFDVSQPRQSVDFSPKGRNSVSFQPITQPAYSANLDQFSPNHGRSSIFVGNLNKPDDFASSNPLFDETGERVAGTHGMALTRTSVAAQVLNSMATQDNAAAEAQVRHSMQAMQHQVCTL